MNEETRKRGIEALKAIGQYNVQLITHKLKDAKIASEYMSDVEADNLIVFTKEETENIFTELTTLIKENQQLRDMLRETVMRAQIAFPENELDNTHFEEQFINQSDLMIKLFEKCGLRLNEDFEKY